MVLPALTLPIKVVPGGIDAKLTQHSTVKSLVPNTKVDGTVGPILRELVLPLKYADPAAAAGSEYAAVGAKGEKAWMLGVPDTVIVLGASALSLKRLSCRVSRDVAVPVMAAMLVPAA